MMLLFLLVVGLTAVDVAVEIDVSDGPIAITTLRALPSQRGIGILLARG